MNIVNKIGDKKLPEGMVGIDVNLLVRELDAEDLPSPHYWDMLKIVFDLVPEPLSIGTALIVPPSGEFRWGIYGHSRTLTDQEVVDPMCCFDEADVFISFGWFYDFSPRADVNRHMLVTRLHDRWPHARVYRVSDTQSSLGASKLIVSGDMPYTSLCPIHENSPTAFQPQGSNFREELVLSAAML
jgi:hypothetical protein